MYWLKKLVAIMTTTKRKINYKAINGQLLSALASANKPHEKRRIEEALVKLNDRLVYRVAHRWSNYKNVPLTVEELYSLGLDGLLIAARRFDPTKGVHFSTFATNHINGAIKRFIRDKGSMIRIPQSIQGKGEGKISVGSIQFVSIDKEESTFELEREYVTGISESEVEQWLRPFKGVYYTPTQVRDKCIEALNTLVDMGVIETEKIRGDSTVIGGVEYRQPVLW